VPRQVPKQVPKQVPRQVPKHLLSKIHLATMYCLVTALAMASAIDPT